MIHSSGQDRARIFCVTQVRMQHSNRLSHELAHQLLNIVWILKVFPESYYNFKEIV